MKTNRVEWIAALTILLLIAGSVPSYAHGVLSKEIETGKVGFSYDDGSPLARGYVTVYDKDGKEIATGQTDDGGIFDYSTYENVGKVSITDTHGHHQTHAIGGGEHHHTHGHAHDHGHEHRSGGNRMVVLVVVAALLAIAAVFYTINRKKNGSSVKSS